MGVSDHGESWVLRLEQSRGDLLRCLRAHVEDLSIAGQRRACLLKKPLHRTRVAGGDAQAGASRDGLEPRITMRCHLAKIRNRLKARLGIAQALQHFIFHASGDDLSIGTAAVEDGGSFVHEVMEVATY
jgi:hypothetical protein